MQFKYITSNDSSKLYEEGKNNNAYSNAILYPL